MSRNIKIGQVNLQHAKASSYLLAARLIKLQDFPYIFLVQEPWVRLKIICGIRSVKEARIFYDERSIGPRVCVLMARRLEATMLRQFCSEDLVAVIVQYQINGGRRNIIVASAYLPYDSLYPPPTQDLRDLVAYAESNSLELLIDCDANAEHFCWGSNNCNPRAEKLFDFITLAGLKNANVECATKRSN